MKEGAEALEPPEQAGRHWAPPRASHPECPHELFWPSCLAGQRPRACGQTLPKPATTRLI
eukprot:11633147-Alexandrium_andersonii.AAC.1